VSARPNHDFGAASNLEEIDFGNKSEFKRNEPGATFT
jgi:hypothetical protein